MRPRIFRRNKKRHILYSLFNRKWVYISYIPDVYYNKKNTKYMLSHQNKREALVIGDIFYSTLKLRFLMPLKNAILESMISYLV